MICIAPQLTSLCREREKRNYILKKSNARPPTLSVQRWTLRVVPHCSGQRFLINNVSKAAIIGKFAANAGSFTVTPDALCQH
jgi:hypothetical protein